MKKPDFFILGAPKCGTTSLADWLREHPSIFMCGPKEPHYFNSDSEHHGAVDLPHYESLFEDADDSHLAVGEASVWYLVSETAVDNILQYQPRARFIICIRNPVEMAVSLHDQKRFSGDEPIANFADRLRVDGVAIGWRQSAALGRAAAALPHIHPERRRVLLQSISEAAATAPGWSNREPAFYPDWVEKVPESALPH